MQRTLRLIPAALLVATGFASTACASQIYGQPAAATTATWTSAPTTTDTVTGFARAQRRPPRPQLLVQPPRPIPRRRRWLSALGRRPRVLPPLVPPGIPDRLQRGLRPVRQQQPVSAFELPDLTELPNYPQYPERACRATAAATTRRRPRSAIATASMPAATTRGVAGPTTRSRTRRYRDGDHDYNNRYGSRDAYKREYRAAFEQGYREGYRGRG